MKRLSLILVLSLFVLAFAATPMYAQSTPKTCTSTPSVKFPSEKPDYQGILQLKFNYIKEKLITIRDVQAVYKNENKKFFADADSLADFALNGTVNIDKNVGEIPEGMNEKDALKAGLLRKETVQISAMEKVMETDNSRTPENFKNLQYVLGTDGPKLLSSLRVIRRII